jgi:hypothetical protein
MFWQSDNEICKKKSFEPEKYLVHQSSDIDFYSKEKTGWDSIDVRHKTDCIRCCGSYESTPSRLYDATNSAAYKNTKWYLWWSKVCVLNPRHSLHWAYIEKLNEFPITFLLFSEIAL